MLDKLFMNLIDHKDYWYNSSSGKHFEDMMRTFLSNNDMKFKEINYSDIKKNEALSDSVFEKKWAELKNKIIDKKSVESCTNPFSNISNSFIYQPFGSQNFPDFIFFVDKYVIPIEIKFTTNKSKKTSLDNKPVWNSNLPKANAIYIYGISGKELTFFLGSDVLDMNVRVLLLNFWDEMNVDMLNKTLDENLRNLNNNFGFYPYVRKAYEQKAEKATYCYRNTNSGKKSVESFFSENRRQREKNVIEYLKVLVNN